MAHILQSGSSGCVHFIHFNSGKAAQIDRAFSQKARAAFNMFVKDSSIGVERTCSHFIGGSKKRDLGGVQAINLDLAEQGDDDGAVHLYRIIVCGASEEIYIFPHRQRLTCSMVIAAELCPEDWTG